MRWKDKLADAIADAKFRAADRHVRCRAKKDGKRCQLDKTHHPKSKHQHFELIW